MFICQCTKIDVQQTWSQSSRKFGKGQNQDVYTLIFHLALVVRKDVDSGLEKVTLKRYRILSKKKYAEKEIQNSIVQARIISSRLKQ